MSKAPRPKRLLEVSLMYEPHRQQHLLVREAYAQLLTETRRSISQEGFLGHAAEKSADDAERKSA
jgi:hypothetical protein